MAHFNIMNFSVIWCCIIILIFSIQISYNTVHTAAIGQIKRTISTEDNIENVESSSDSLHINYDEYPMIVPKRAAILLDRILVALHHALEDGDKQGVRRINDLYSEARNSNKKGKLSKDYQRKIMSNDIDDDKKTIDDMYDVNDDIPEPILAEKDLNQHQLAESTMDLQRRGHGSDSSALMTNNRARVFWRCYFNAVTCF